MCNTQTTSVSTATTENSLGLSVRYLVLSYILNALNAILFYTAIYEFICAQSPHAMKGLLIGTFFLIRGLFQLVGITAVFFPFTWWGFETSFRSCGFVNYLINITVAFISLFAYICVSRRYQYCQRDEPDNIDCYAEEYYDRGTDQLENTYDYSNNYDNLNVHTVD